MSSFPTLAVFSFQFLILLKLGYKPVAVTPYDAKNPVLKDKVSQAKVLSSEDLLFLIEYFAKTGQNIQIILLAVIDRDRWGDLC